MIAWNISNLKLTNTCLKIAIVFYIRLAHWNNNRYDEFICIIRRNDRALMWIWNMMLIYIMHYGMLSCLLDLNSLNYAYYSFDFGCVYSILFGGAAVYILYMSKLRPVGNTIAMGKQFVTNVCYSPCIFSNQAYHVIIMNSYVMLVS